MAEPTTYTTLTDPTGHMAPGSGGPLSATGPYADGEIPYPFANWWDWSTYAPLVVLRNPKVSQKAVNDAKKAQKKACCDPPNSAQRIIQHLPGLMTPFLALEGGRAAARRSRGRPERSHSTGERRRAAYPNEL